MLVTAAAVALVSNRLVPMANGLLNHIPNLLRPSVVHMGYCVP